MQFVKKACDVCNISRQEFFLDKYKIQVVNARVMVIKEMTNKGYDIADVATLLMFEKRICQRYLDSFEFRYTKEEFFRNLYKRYQKIIK